MLKNIGLTGGIACGKSKVADIFSELGYYTIDSDLISRKVMEKGEAAYIKIVEYFGKDILDGNENIIRKKLGSIVFTDKDKLKVLEEIVHPAIFNYEKKLRSEIFGKNDKAVIITHAAKMIESKSYTHYDALIVVTADKDIQLSRLIKRDNITIEQAQNILNNQLSNEERLKYAQFIIDNSSDIDNLYIEVKRVHNLITQINYGEKHNK